MAHPKPDFPPIRACIFDMDGLLIDSEDIYTECTNAILHEYGKPSLPWKIKAQLQGRPGPESSAIFQAWAQLPITPSEFASKLSVHQARLFPFTRPLPGAPILLATLASSPSSVHLALATSSHERNYHLKTAHITSLFTVFPPSQRVLGDDERIPKGRGKPAGDIYELALETINDGIRGRGMGEKEVRREECLVFEDSVPGVEAGRRAGMRVVWCPHKELLKEYKGREEEVLAGLTGEHKEGEVKEVLVDAGAEGRVRGWPGRVGDGWGQLLETLKDFPYVSYGIEQASAPTSSTPSLLSP